MINLLNHAKQNKACEQLQQWTNLRFSHSHSSRLSVSRELCDQWPSLEEGQTSNQYPVKKHWEKLETEIMQCLQENVDMLMQLKLFMLDNFVQTFEVLH